MTQGVRYDGPNGGAWVLCTTRLSICNLLKNTTASVSNVFALSQFLESLRCSLRTASEVQILKFLDRSDTKMGCSDCKRINKGEFLHCVGVAVPINCVEQPP